MGYKELMEKSDEAMRKAVEYYGEHDIYMSVFWKNASIGFKEKALNLEVKR